ncbi:hypothetical protein B5807_00083 [Epicoccum nigrum]|uniref:Rhodopsin domain-containing protein n=1 Tax=Epicoccum nigrum TaxID=105696 RepID=A0A1Y2MD79_EPING|nr:hypothetical protein B5807_00083 [Epicoccum nigrum]
MSADGSADEVTSEQVPQSILPRAQLDGVNIAMLAVTSVVFITATMVKFAQRKPCELHDIFRRLAFTSYVVMWTMCSLENDPLYRFESVQRGETPIYPEMVHDAGMFLRFVTAGQLFYYATLALVKISFLLLYRKLLDRTSRKYNVAWWVILAFCLLSVIVPTLQTVFLCNDQKAKYNQGACAKPDEQYRSVVALWVSYALDVATDLAVMFLPYRLTWNISLPKTRKFGIFMLFGSGWVCILFATLRVVQVGVRNGVPSTPDAKWVQMWAIIETSMAVITSCAPAFAGILQRRFGTRAVSYDSRGFVKRPMNDDIWMKQLENGMGKRSKRDDTVLWTNGQGSQEALADPGGLITDTTTKVGDNELGSRHSTRSWAQMAK